MPVIARLSPFEHVDYCRVGAAVCWLRLVAVCERVFAQVAVTGTTIIAIGDARAARIRIKREASGVFMVVGSHGRDATLRHYEALAIREVFREASEAVWFFDEYELR